MRGWADGLAERAGRAAPGAREADVMKDPFVTLSMMKGSFVMLGLRKGSFVVPGVMKGSFVNAGT
jgi:hypothetical protein